MPPKSYVRFHDAVIQPPVEIVAWTAYLLTRPGRPASLPHAALMLELAHELDVRRS